MLVPIRHSMSLVLILLLAGATAHAWYDLPDALRDGIVSVEVNGNGSSSGDAIVMTVWRTSRSPIGEFMLLVKPGTKFTSRNSALQNMVAANIKGERVSDLQYTPATSLRIPAEGKATFILEAYCAEFAKGNPSSTTDFSVEAPDPDLAELITLCNLHGLSIQAKQAAVWMATDQITYEHMTEKFSISRDDWQAAERVFSIFKPTATLATTQEDEWPATPDITVVTLENLTGENLMVEVTGKDTSIIPMDKGQVYGGHFPVGHYTLNVQYGDEAMNRHAVIPIDVTEETRHIRLKPPTGKLKRPVNAPPVPPRKILKTTAWREVSADGNTITYTQPLDKAFTGCDETFEHTCFDGCRIISVSLTGSPDKTEIATITAQSADGESIAAGQAVDGIRRELPDGKHAYSSDHRPVLNMPQHTTITKVTVQLTGCAKVLVQSVDLDSFLAK